MPDSVLGALDGATLRRVAITGGPITTVCQADLPFGMRWQGSRILFSIGNRIQVVAETGGTPSEARCR